MGVDMLHILGTLAEKQRIFLRITPFIIYILYHQHLLPVTKSSTPPNFIIYFLHIIHSISYVYLYTYAFYISD